jgi:hypothetical protein
MTLTFAQLISIQEPLQRLARARMEARAAFRIGLLVKLLAPHMAAASEARLRAYREFGTEDEHGSVHVTPDRMADLRKAMEPLLEMPVEVHLDPIPLASLAGVDALSAEDLLALGPLIAE